MTVRSSAPTIPDSPPSARDRHQPLLQDSLQFLKRQTCAVSVGCGAEIGENAEGTFAARTSAAEAARTGLRQKCKRRQRQDEAVTGRGTNCSASRCRAASGKNSGVGGISPDGQKTLIVRDEDSMASITAPAAWLELCYPDPGEAPRPAYCRACAPKKPGGQCGKGRAKGQLRLFREVSNDSNPALSFPPVGSPREIGNYQYE
jgi:hypothetical protein